MFKKIGVLFSLLLIMMSGFQFAEAKRFGRSSSFGFRRTQSSQVIKKGTKNSSQKSKGLGMLGGILTALGLGALFAWLFSSHGITGVLIVIALFALLLFFMRRKMLQQQSGQASNSHGFSQSNTNDMGSASAIGGPSSSSAVTGNIQIDEESVIKNGQLPDGTPEAVFTHQAVNMFNQLQSLNTKDGLARIQGYLTPDLYQSIAAEIEENDEIAEFKGLNCKVIACDRQDNIWMTSVMFVGEVKEDRVSNWESFEEVWHFARQDGEHLWQVAGVQQF